MAIKPPHPLYNIDLQKQVTEFEDVLELDPEDDEPEISDPGNDVHDIVGMRSEDLHHKPILPNDEISLPKSGGRPKGVKNHSKSIKIKVQSPGSASAGAGSILKRLRKSKIVGKGRSCSASSPVEVSNGKHSNSCSIPVDEVLTKVLDKMAYDKSIALQMVFKEGVKDCDVESSRVVKGSSHSLINGNDGSFIKDPIEPVVADMDTHSNCLENKDGDVELFNTFVDPCLVSNDASKLNMADVEHVGVESIRKANKDGNGRDKEGNGFVFGSNKVNIAILKRPTVGSTSVQFGPSLFHKSSNVWSSKKTGINSLNGDGSINIESFAEKMQKGVEERELQMSFVPQYVSKLSDGTRRIGITVEDIKKGAEDCSLQLYGYFVGTSMDYRVANINIRRMWTVYDVADITKTNSGIFYLRFKSKKRMKAILESGPWMVNNVPLVLNVWEPGLCLEKVEPSTIPIWLWMISQLFWNFVTLLLAIGLLEVKYQWNPPPLCTHCKTFGHSTIACKVRPKSEEEIAASVLKDAIKVNGSSYLNNNVNVDNDGFVVVGKKKKPVVTQSNTRQSYSQSRNVASSFQNRGFQNSNRNGSGNFRQRFGRQAPNQQNRNGGHKLQGVVMKNKGVGGSSSNGNSLSSFKKPAMNRANESLVKKPPLASVYNQDIRPKVLVKGSASGSNTDKIIEEDVPISNSFHVLTDDVMNEENDVDELMEAGIYPSKEIRANWSLKQMEYFYNNCHKFSLDPVCEDGEDDVDSETEGIVADMKPEFDVNPVDAPVNVSAENQDVSNDGEDDVDSETEGVVADMKPEFDVNPVDAPVNVSAENQDVSNGI
ncbi:hypothetical protein CTI12_AA022120 [Artemisia annua]|uniref:DUF4283 domain-containing protein n=1 Tax=Artemisia annua TaxID=35608 RepID=A0A2U1QJI4_ARTAN|nr:hypothetical protein CTI12_AA022120 [Artemisia annua]